MALRSRLARSIVAGALAAAAFTTPAVASDEWELDEPGQSQGDGDGGGDQGGGDGGGGGGGGDWGGDQGGGDGGGSDGGDEGGGDGRRFTKGRVTADRLLLRSAPNRGSRVIGAVHRGDVVRIFCRTPGQRVDGNPLWYLLSDGTWAWGSARFIDDLGAAPRWC
ncbi:SH3 domain-containing protein [Streptomyces sp. AS02]|uniref:SH3 domain-containing protein n=1 Tax=Streptomyces sp. AS02 TaxID=2938946 RepID=UPI0020222F57|nr:SH3 domain-containing protein [Streptomyces sp. AS02]MCL8015662.1 SH3 domain-containing protein [Streptomyces sp. AS02]